MKLGTEIAGRGRALWISTLAFTVCFAAWTVFSIIGLQIRLEFGLSGTQFGLLIGTPILTGSLIRIVLGIWADQYGGRTVLTLVMLAAAAATFLLSWATSYPAILVAAVGVGIAGGSFAAGVSYLSRWYPSEQQGAVLGIFSVGHVGAALTLVLAPYLLESHGWQMVVQIWAAALAIAAALFWLIAREDPVTRERRISGQPVTGLWQQLEPLRHLQVWRFSFYYFFVFGAFVGLSLWLPYYLIGVYNLDIATAGMIAALFALAAAAFRPYGNRLTDKYGARQVMYWTLSVSVICTFILSYPPTDYTVRGIDGPIVFHFEIGLITFGVVTAILGFFMGLGMAAVYKHIPVYYPKSVGAVSGLVGMIGGLGGFLLPLAFGLLSDLTRVWSTSFMLLFLLVSIALTWMHFAIRRMERGVAEHELRRLPEFPEMQEIHEPKHAGVLGPHLISDWRPENPEFWNSTGRAIARRNLWLSIPALLLSFAVWMVWSVVVAKLPAVGFKLTTDQLFWLAALPGLSGATLRIFYSFMPPIFGGRLWTTLSTWSLMIPAIGIGLAVQSADTPYFVLLGLALLCGFGGGNFASSMANISFFFPKAEKGNALALNAGLGNLGVSIVQFVVPLAITAGVFGWLGGEPQAAVDGDKTTRIWLQNAGYIWVPFIAASAFAAWFGMNDIAAMRASFAEQAVIFRRRHNWIMCWLYTGTFGSFIGYSAGFPLLAKTQFPGVDPLQLAFVGPLAGALSRSATGWISDKYGGGRVTFWVFVLMMVGVLGVLYFLGIKDQPYAFWGFFASFILLFFATGVGNASTFQMIPAIMRKEIARLEQGMSLAETIRQADKESAAIIGFTSAVAAYGAFFIPKSYGTSIALTGGAELALWGFLVFYMSCLLITWGVYTRRGGLLYDVERQAAKKSQPQASRAASRAQS
jgi:NNP family nitrate/nitrite transporter-like MFS transporter